MQIIAMKPANMICGSGADTYSRHLFNPGDDESTVPQPTKEEDNYYYSE